MRPQFGASRAWLGSFICQRSRLATAVFTAMFICVAGVSNSGCEDQAIGRTCETLADKPMPNSAVFNDEALECPTRLCIQPASELGSNIDQATAPFCTAECSKNSDCEDGQRRDKNNPNDKRCTKPFVCAVVFDTGPLRCRKMCVCGDFYKDPKAATTVPAVCAPAAP